MGSKCDVPRMRHHRKSLNAPPARILPATLARFWTTVSTLLTGEAAGPQIRKENFK